MLRGLWNWGEIFPLPRKNAEKAVFQAILWGKQIFKLGDSREKSITYRFRKGLESSAWGERFNSDHHAIGVIVE